MQTRGYVVKNDNGYLAEIKNKYELDRLLVTFVYTACLSNAKVYNDLETAVSVSKSVNGELIEV